MPSTLTSAAGMMSSAALMTPSTPAIKSASNEAGSVFRSRPVSLAVTVVFCWPGCSAGSTVVPCCTL